MGNAGIVDLGDRTVVFDAFMTPQAGAELRIAAEALTGRRPELLVLSHAHNDHAWGSVAFPDVPLLSTAAARDELAAFGPAGLVHWQASAVSDAPVTRNDAAFFLPYWQSIAAVVPTLELRLPDLAIEGRLAIHGTTRRAEVVPVGRAHGAGDCVLVLPDDGIAFAGDVLFVRCHPYLGDGDIGTLRETLGLLEQTGATTLVPGHGPVGGPAEIGVLLRYLDDVERLAATGPETAMPEAYAAWALRPFFSDNLEFAAAGGHQPEPAAGS